MLKLTRQRESRWIELDGLGVRIKVKPLTTAIMEAFRSEAIKRLAALRLQADEQARAGFPLDPAGANITNPAWRDGLAAQMMAEGLLRYAAEEWEGVVGDDGIALPLDAAAIEAFAAHDQAASAFLREIMAPVSDVSAEGNVSAPCSPGAGAGGATTAQDAAMAGAQPVH